MMSAEKYRFVDLFGNPMLVPSDVKYIGHIVGDGKSRVFCPSGVTQQEAELFYQNACKMDSSLRDEPVCIVMSQ